MLVQHNAVELVRMSKYSGIFGNEEAERLATKVYISPFLGPGEVLKWIEKKYMEY